jgi:hypothetical protein
MDVIILAIIGFVAIAGPAILTLLLYWRDNPDRRLSWRRAAENSADTDPEHFRRPSGQAWLFFMVAAAAAEGAAAATVAAAGGTAAAAPAEVGCRGAVPDRTGNAEPGRVCAWATATRSGQQERQRVRSQATSTRTMRRGIPGGGEEHAGVCSTSPCW